MLVTYFEGTTLISLSPPCSLPLVSEESPFSSYAIFFIRVQILRTHEIRVFLTPAYFTSHHDFKYYQFSCEWHISHFGETLFEVGSPYTVQTGLKLTLRWNLSICISLMVTNVEHFFIEQLAVSSSVEKCLFNSFVHWSSWLFSWCDSFGSLYMLHMSPLVRTPPIL